MNPNFRFTLQAGADFVRTGRAAKILLTLIRKTRKLITFTQERENRLPRYVVVTNAYKRGMPLADIQKQYGCSRTTIHRYAMMAGLPHRPRGFEPGVKEAVLTDYKAKHPIAVIAARHGVSEAYVSVAAREAGILRRQFKSRKK